MALEQIRRRYGALLAGAALGLAWGASASCATDDHAGIRPSLVTTDVELAADIQGWLELLSPEDRAAFEREILWRKDLVIHVVSGDLPSKDSRGGASSWSWTDFSKTYCKKHPNVEGVPRRQDWDVIVDRRLAEKWTKKCEIPNPPDVIMYHEIYGHILWLLRNPEFLKNREINERLKAVLEDKARIIENQYRTYRKLPNVPRHMSKPCWP